VSPPRSKREKLERRGKRGRARIGGWQAPGAAARAGDGAQGFSGTSFLLAQRRIAVKVASERGLRWLAGFSQSIMYVHAREIYDPPLDDILLAQFEMMMTFDDKFLGQWIVVSALF
jgi:hypothetical protein